MNGLLNISNIGYTAYNNPMRAIRSGAEFEEIIPAPDWQTQTVKRGAKVEEVVAEMQKLIRQSAWQTKELSKRLLGKDIYTTCGNIWNFLFSHIKYKEDDKGQEQLRTPAVSWSVRTSRGIDCDDFSIFAGCILYNLNIPFYLRIARYPKVDYFQHVYVIVPQTKDSYITIDAVLDEYDAEKEPAETKDFLVMDDSKLNGIDVTVLSGIEDDTLKEIAGILFGVDFGEIEELEGTDNEPDEQAILGAIYKHLVRTRNAVSRYPHIIKTVEDPQTFLGMLDYGIKYWDTENWDMALGILEEKEEELNRLNGLDAMQDGYEDTTVFYGVEGFGTISALGKAKVKKTFFKNVKKAVQTTKQNVKQKAQKISQKVKQAAPKIKKVLVKNNPVSVAARTGMLAAMKTNLFKIAETLKWGYLTESEASEAGLDIPEWRNARTQLTKAENLFVNKLKGSAEKFKQAILKGRAGGLKGVTEDLGVVAVAAATTSLAAAMPFIKQIMEFAKAVNLKKLIGKVKASKLMQKNKKAETMPEVSDESPTALPEPTEVEKETPALPDRSGSNQPNQESEGNQSSASGESNNEQTNSGASNKKENEEGSNTTDNNKSETENQENQETNNLPATTTSREMANSTDTEDKSPITKITDWVKENKGYSALIVGGLVLAFSSGARKAIGLGKAPRKYKKRKGNAKNNPPTISGTGKKKPNKKSLQGKGKGKGNGPKRITL